MFDDSATLTDNVSALNSAGDQIFNGILTIGNNITFNATQAGNITFSQTVNASGVNLIIGSAHNVSGPGNIIVNNFTLTADGNGLFSGGLNASGNIQITANHINGSFQGGQTLLIGMQGILGQVDVQSLTLGGLNGATLTGRANGIGGRDAAREVNLAPGAEGIFTINGVRIGVPVDPVLPVPANSASSSFNNDVKNLVRQTMKESQGSVEQFQSNGKLDLGTACAAGELSDAVCASINLTEAVSGPSITTGNPNQEMVLLPDGNILLN